MLSALLLLITTPAWAQFKVIGYLSSWTGEMNAVQYDKLTHINYAFLLPNADGSLRPIENPTKLQILFNNTLERPSLTRRKPYPLASTAALVAR